MNEIKVKNYGKSLELLRDDFVTCNEVNEVNREYL